jgi:hypothetical protein
MRSEGLAACRKEKKGLIGYCWKNLKVKRLLGRCRRTCDDNLKMSLRSSLKSVPGFIWLKKNRCVLML